MRLDQLLGTFLLLEEKCAKKTLGHRVRLDPDPWTCTVVYAVVRKVQARSEQRVSRLRLSLCDQVECPESSPSAHHLRMANYATMMREACTKLSRPCAEKVLMNSSCFFPRMIWYRWMTASYHGGKSPWKSFNSLTNGGSASLSHLSTRTFLSTRRRTFLPTCILITDISFPISSSSPLLLVLDALLMAAWTPTVVIVEGPALTLVEHSSKLMSVARPTRHWYSRAFVMLWLCVVGLQ